MHPRNDFKQSPSCYNITFAHNMVLRLAYETLKHYFQKEHSQRWYYKMDLNSIEQFWKRYVED